MDTYTSAIHQMHAEGYMAHGNTKQITMWYMAHGNTKQTTMRYKKII
jgi:hypothetical protein